MSVRLKAGVIAMTTLLSLPVSAGASQNAYQQELMRLDSDAQTFVQTGNLSAVDPESLTDDAYYSPNNFPGASGSVRLPDADLDAITRAVLLLDAHEAPLPHVRYLIHYSMNVSADFPDVQHDYIDITRFNLGPARRADLLEFVSEEHVASPDEFGVGPHVNWRFAMAPVMGMGAGLLYASRKNLPEQDAQKMSCLGEPCLSLVDAEGPRLDWGVVMPPKLDSALYRDKNLSGSTRSARVVQELWANMSADGMDPLMYKQGQPHFVFVVSVDVSGQDVAVSGLAQQTTVMDHTVKEIWTRRDEAGEAPAGFARAYVPRR